MLKLIKRLMGYDGSMEFVVLNDEDVVNNYQHGFVVDYYRKNIEGRSVLDAGCWTGPLEKTISGKGIETNLVGIDENRDALSVARKNFPEYHFAQCQLLNKNEEFIEKYKNFFDTIIFLDVVEHIPRGREIEVLQFFNKLLKPGGSLILSTMSSHFLNFIDPAWFFGHRHYTQKKIEGIIGRAGFAIEDNLKNGNLFWDLDLLFFYIYKHIFKKKYKTSEKMYKRILKGIRANKNSTRFYIKAKNR